MQSWNKLVSAKINELTSCFPEAHPHNTPFDSCNQVAQNQRIVWTWRKKIHIFPKTQEQLFSSPLSVNVRAHTGHPQIAWQYRTWPHKLGHRQDIEVRSMILEDSTTRAEATAIMALGSSQVPPLWKFQIYITKSKGIDFYNVQIKENLKYILEISVMNFRSLVQWNEHSNCKPKQDLKTWNLKELHQQHHAITTATEQITVTAEMLGWRSNESALAQACKQLWNYSQTLNMSTNSLCEVGWRHATLVLCNGWT